MIQLYLMNWRAISASEARAVLNPEEIARADRYRRDEARDRFISCRALLKKVLALHCNAEPELLRIVQEERSKPKLDQFPSLSFNQSHSGEWLLIATSDSVEVGCDLEELAAYSTNRVDSSESDGSGHLSKLGKYFSDSENQWVSRSGDLEIGTLRLWTVYEALYKAGGVHDADRDRVLQVLARDSDRREVLRELGSTHRFVELCFSPNLISALAWLRAEAVHSLQPAIWLRRWPCPSGAGAVDRINDLPNLQLTVSSLL